MSHDPVWASIEVNQLLLAVGIVTLIVLCLYAWDTRKIACATVEQAENAQTPFLALTTQYEEEERPNVLPRRNKRWALENHGNATAINIRVKGQSFHKSPDSSTEILKNFDPIRSSGSCWLDPYCVENILCCEIIYESLDGRKFRTHVNLVDGELIVQFHKLRRK